MGRNAAEIRIKGQAELEAAFLELRREVLTGLRPALLALAARVRGEARSMAPEEITNVGPQWGQFRIGVARSEPLVYLAPKQRSRGAGSPRPNMGGLLMQVMSGALDRHQDEIVAGLDALIDGSEIKAGF